ncbi:MAG: hypothetical protein NW218_10860 [Saprospiraceae bacterium]|nr:hypothetical protein [Saprospiraceae bacterium]
MGTLELKNKLLRMVSETDDPLILKQLITLFATLKSEEDWWDKLDDVGVKKIQEGQMDKEQGNTYTHDQVRAQAKAIFQP